MGPNLDNGRGDPQQTEQELNGSSGNKIEKSAKVDGEAQAGPASLYGCLHFQLKVECCIPG